MFTTDLVACHECFGRFGCLCRSLIQDRFRWFARWYALWYAVSSRAGSRLVRAGSRFGSRLFRAQVGGWSARWFACGFARWFPRWFAAGSCSELTPKTSEAKKIKCVGSALVRTLVRG